jgi:hypothetical protein
LRDVAKKLKEEKAILEGMVESRDELITEIAKEIGLDRMGEDAEAEAEDDEDGGDNAAPPTAVPPPTPTPPTTAAPEEIIIEEDPVKMVPKQEAPVAHEVILVDVEPELPHPRLCHMLMRDYEESPSRMMDDSTEAISDMDEWFPEDRSNDRD